MRFEHSQLLWFLPLIVAGLTAFFWWAWRAKRQLVSQFIAARLLANLTVGVSTRRQKARMALLVASAALLIIVLARPQIGFSWEEARSRGLDIIVAIDTSKSMLAADVAPNRLRRAQLAALDLKRLARADRLGLVAFAGSAFLQCPLSLDDEAFRQSVEILDVNIIPQGGTALAEAIQTTLAAFKDKTDNHRALVLFTDGEDHDGNALEAAKQAAKEGLRIFTVGVGTANGELLGVMDAQGRAEFLKDADGNAVKSRLNEELLRQIAQETGGFYMLLSGANTMNVLYERGLEPLPKGELTSQRVKRHHERYQWLLGLVIGLLLVEMLLPERKQIRQISEAGVPAAGQPAKAVAILLLLLLPSIATASSAKALKHYQAGRYEPALNEYERALKSKPNDPRLHFNAGASAFQAGEFEQALDHLNSALVAQDLSLQERAFYNLGNTHYRLGEDASQADKKKGLWEQAVRSYESALKLEPKDTDAQFNLELVKKKLEELKQQQQQQQNKDNQKDQDKQDQQQQKDQQSKDQQSKDQQKQDQQKQQQDQNQQQKPEDQQQQQQQASDKEKKDAEKKEGQQASKSQDKQDEEGEKDAQPQGVAALRMTPQQAIQLLEAMKGEERTLQFRPPLKTNRQVFKDW